MARIDYRAFRYLAARWPARTALALVTLPVHALVRATRFALRVGAPARSDVGFGVRRQVLEIWLFALRYPLTYGSNPRLYYTQQAYLPERRGDAPFVLSDMHHAALCRSIGGRDVRALSKGRFEGRCAELGVPCAGSIATVSRDGDVTWTAGRTTLPEEDLFSKPVHGTKGAGALRWSWQGEGRYLTETGETLDTAGVLQAMKAAASGGDLLVQPRLRNHPAIEPLFGATLATVRILTVLDGQGGLDFVLAVHRSAADDVAVDNFTQGGVACAVDMDSGELGEAVSVGPAGVRFEATHPATGAHIPGFRLPFWQETRARIERVHTEGFTRTPVVGWDVAITPTGPVLIEGNAVPGIRSLQAAHRVALGRLPYARRLLALLEPESERA